MAAASDSHAEFNSAVNNALKDYPVESLHKEQEVCLRNLVYGRDVFGILPSGFGKSLIFQLFLRVMSTVNQNDTVSTIIVVTPLVAIMKYQVDQLNKIWDCVAMAIGIDVDAIQ